METEINETYNVNLIPEYIAILQERIQQLETGLNHIVASSHSYVLRRHKAGDENIHSMYRRIAKKALGVKE